MIKIVDTPLIPKQVKKVSKKFVAEHLNDNGCTIESVHLGGSYTKNTSNDESDIDLNIYYKIPLRRFLLTTIQTPMIEGCQFSTDVDSKATTYEYQGKEFEVEYIPIKKNTAFKKELSRALIQPNIDIVFKFMKDYPINQTPIMKRFLAWMQNGYYLKPESTFGYFDGYMTSQLQRHVRRKDGQRRMLQARKFNSVTPVVKLTVDGLYMALSGINLLLESEISRDIKKLWKKYSYLFTEEQNQFIEYCIDHKINRTPPDRGTWDWVSYAMDKRDEMFEILHLETKKALATTPLEWSDWMGNDNRKSIESWLMEEFYNESQK